MIRPNLIGVVLFWSCCFITNGGKPKLSTEGELIMKETRELIAGVESKCKKGTDGLNNNIKTAGGIYIRWGKSSCPSNGTELVYSGQMGGSNIQHTGAAVNYLCLPSDPLWGSYKDAATNAAFVYGAETDTHFIDIPNTPFQLKYHMKDLTCAVCRSTQRSSVLMIPGRNRCYNGWHLEYDGYLSAGFHRHKAGSEYICFDKTPDHLHGGGTQRNIFTSVYQVEAMCTPLRCPPYVQGRELTCSVCTK